MQDKIREKKLGYFEIESIDNPCHIVLAINPKEYYEHFEDFANNRKHKGQKKGTYGMNFENLALRIATSNQIDMFSQTNDKKFYNLNGITSLPIGHPYLKDLTTYKENKGKGEKYFIKEKENLQRLEIEAFLKTDRLNRYNQMLSQNFEYYDLNNNTKVDHDNLKTNFSQSTQSFILEAKWI